MPAPHRIGVVRRAASGFVEVGVTFPHPRRPNEPRAGHYVLTLTPDNAGHLLAGLRGVIEEGERIGAARAPVPHVAAGQIRPPKLRGLPPIPADASEHAANGAGYVLGVVDGRPAWRLGLIMDLEDS